MDEAVYRIVMSRPIPDKLSANLRLLPLLRGYAIRRDALRENVTDTLLTTLEFVCVGYSNHEIAELRHYSYEAIKDHIRRLLAIFRARSRAHLAALAVARGFVAVE